jgi:beta-lactamase superfamily II metal-dependent hydrolase
VRAPERPARRAVATIFALFVLVAAVPARAASPGNGKLQIVHLNAAQGDAAVLISPEGQVAMFDDGSSTSFCTHCPSCASVLSQLQSLGITHVALHFASHYHADHIGCISSLTGITIDQGWDRAQSYTSGAYTSYVNYLGAKRHTLTKGMVFTLDSLSAHPVTLTCVALAGDGISTSDENGLSVVMKISYGEFDEEIGGDLVGSGSGDIETKVGPQVGPIEVYKVHHHGSSTSTNENWLNATQPKIAIVPVGIGNSYGHPTSAVMTRLHNHGVRTYWTEQGAGVAPNPAYDKVANGMIRIVATWLPGGVDSIYADGIADTFTNSGTADLAAPIVTVLLPNGGESWASGSVQSVEWSASDNVGVASVDVDYSLHGHDGPWIAAGHGLANTGHYDWTLPPETSDSALVRLTAFDASSNQAVDLSDAPFHLTAGALGVPDGAALRFALAPPVPNPTRGDVVFGFTLAAPAATRLEVLDVTGRRVWAAPAAGLAAGEHAVRWDGRDAGGSPARSGLYFVRLDSGGRTAIVRFVRLR